jgi:hypothetical protein
MENIMLSIEKDCNGFTRTEVEELVGMKLPEVFTAEDGRQWFEGEAKVNTAFKAFKTDRRKAEPGNRRNCILTRGINRDPLVVYSEVGSGGHAGVVYRDKVSGAEYAQHYVVPVSGKRIVDEFDRRGSPPTQMVQLLAPPPSLTKAALRRAAKKYTAKKRDDKAAEKAAEKSAKGLERVEFFARKGAKKKPRIYRIERIGAAHRPRPKLRADGSWSMGDEVISTQ